MESKRDKPRRRWWQRLLRLAVLLALVAGAAYVSLPWWLPRAWLRDFLAQRLSRTSGVGVRIARLDLSWGGGLELGDLTIDSSPQAGSLPLVCVSALWADFSPLELVRGKLAWMGMDSPCLYLRANDRGEVDLTPLSRLFKSDVRTELISIRRAAVVLTLPHRAEPFRLEVGDMQILAGSLYPVGQLTLAAGLDQGASLAPVTLRFSEGPREENLVGRAKLSFQGLDLDALGLPQAPWLPLRHFRRLSGLASGDLELAATTEGKINQFRLNISVRRLDVQPVLGPDLPVFEQAWIKLEAGYDFLSGRLDLHSARVRLPGLDLTGEAVAFLDSLGQWDRVSSAQLDGTIYPQQLAALVGGGKDPNDLQLSGPVAVHFAGREPNHPRVAGPALQLTARAVATDAELRRGEHVLKPARRRLEVSLAGGLDGNDWSYSAQGEQVVLLGDNEFRGTGTLSNLRQLTDRWSAKDRLWSAWDVPLDLSHLHWNGSWEIRDLPALADLWPAIGSLLAPVRLEGKITGECFIGQGEGNELILHAALPRGTWLNVPGVLIKPVDQEAKFVLAARLDRLRPQWNDIDLVARMGEASFHLYDGSLSLVGDDEAEPVLTARGQWELLGVESFLKTLDCPAVAVLRSPAGAGVDLSGAMEGSGSIFSGPAATSGRLDVKADRAAFRSAAWVKPALQPAFCKFEFFAQPSPQGWTHSRLSGEYRDPWAEVSVKIAAPDPGGEPGGPQTRCEFHAEVKDASWLVQSCPPVERVMTGGRIKGPAHLAGEVRWNGGGDLDGNVRLDGAELEIALAGGAAKPAGTPLSVRLAGALSHGQGPGAAARLDLRRLELAAAHCTLDLAGRCEIDPSAQVAGGRDLPKAFPAAEMQGGFHADSSLAELLPALAPALRTFGIGGQADGSCRLRVRDGIELQSSIDLGGVWATDLGPFRKPADTPAHAEVAVSLSRDLSRVDSFAVLASLGESNLAVVGKAKLDFVAGGPPRLSQSSGRVAVLIADASQWPALVPGLAPYQPNGDLRFAANWSDEGGFSVPKAEVRTTGLGGTFHGRGFCLAGHLQAEGVTGVVAALEDAFGRSGEPYGPVRVPAQPSGEGGAASRASTPDLPAGSAARPEGGNAAPPALRVARLSTDGLEFLAGENHAWVVADLTDPQGPAPSGRVRVLASVLDDQDLSDWLTGSKPASRDVPGPGASGPAKPGEANAPTAERLGGAEPTAARPGTAERSEARRLSTAEVQKIEDNAHRIVAGLRHSSRRSDLDLRVEIDRFRTFDPEVSQSYEVRQMVIQAAANQGKLRMQVAGGIGGGTFRRTQETDLAEEDPAMASSSAFVDVLANESTRAQLIRFFPGNTVNGSFHYSEKLTMPLWSAVANMLDARAPLRAAGASETTALGGVMEGRAAPQFVTAIFPGLNTTRYSYNRMKAFTKRFADGTAETDMIFNGESYDLYMEGTTDADNIARYDTGLILLSSRQTPELNHDLKLGRLPLLKIKARIEDGKLHDVEVSYPWPNESLGTMFIRNNPFYRLWVTYHDK